MEEIRKMVRRQRLEYALLWIAAALLLLAFDRGWLPEGACVEQPRTCYLLDMAGVVLTLGLIPLSLKLFAWVLARRVRPLPLQEAVSAYRRWSRLRLLMLAGVVLPNIVIHCLTLESTGSFCALMGLTASLFCWPGMKRTLTDLNLAEHETD